MKYALRWLAGNLGLLLLSLSLALLVWVVAVEQENPSSERRLSYAIPLTIPTPPEGLVAYGQSDVQVYVTLRAPESLWRILQPSDLRATVNLNGLGVGEHRLPVQVTVDEGPALVRRVEPAEITLYLEPVAQAEVPVNVRIAGNTAVGYAVGAAEVSPLTVTVRGPASWVAQVVEAVTEVSVEGGRADVVGEFDLHPYGADGAEVPHVTLNPARIGVRVPVEQLRGFRDLTVMAMLEGEVASGYRVSSITVDPPVVTVFGQQDVIGTIPGYIETTPLNVEGARADVEVALPLVIPEGVSLIGMDRPYVTVRVAVVPREGSLTLERTVSVQGASPGLSVTVAPTTVQVILSGPQPILEQLNEQDVRLVVDVFGLTPGSYSLAPQAMMVPESVIVEAIVPSNVQVVLTSGLTPTPRRP